MIFALFDVSRTIFGKCKADAVMTLTPRWFYCQFHDLIFASIACNCMKRKL